MTNNNSQSTNVYTKPTGISPLTNLKLTYFTINLARAIAIIFKALTVISIKTAMGVALIIALIPSLIKDGIQHRILSATVSTPLVMYTTVNVFIAILYVLYMLTIVYRFWKLVLVSSYRTFYNLISLLGTTVAACFLVIALNHIPKSDFELDSPFINQTVYTFLAFACLFLAAHIIMQLVTKLAQNRFAELFYTKEFLADKDTVKLSQFATDRQKQLERLVQPQWRERTTIHELTFTQLPLSEQLTTVFHVDLNKQPYNNVFDFIIRPVMSEFNIAPSRTALPIEPDTEKESK